MFLYFSILFATTAVIVVGNVPEASQSPSKKINFPPHNLHDFKELIWQDYLHVDKSLLIKKFLNLTDTWNNGTVVINQPISWSKSLNLDMLRRFFEIEVDEHGVELPDERKIFKKFFLGGEVVIGDEKKVLHKLYIAKYRDLVEQYQGKFPVIFFSLKNIFDVDFAKMHTSIAERLMNLYSKYPYLKKYCSADDDTIFDLNKIEALSYFNREVSLDTVLDTALYTLSQMLEEHFKQKVVVLIDDYDEAIQYSIQKFANETEKHAEYVNTIGKLLGAVLKGNPYVERSCMTGVFPFNEFGEILDNLNHFLITDVVFTKYFAFVQKEVTKLLATAQTNTTLQDIKAWYNGINFGGLSYYNPVSIMQCLKNKGKLQRYFMQKDRLDFLEGKSINDDVNEIPLQRWFVNATTRLYYYSPVHPMHEVALGKHSDDVFHFFLFAGYMAFEDSVYPPGYLYMSVPNYEVTYAYQRLQLRWTTFNYGFPRGWQVTPGLLLGNYKIKEFEMELQRLLNTTHRLDKVNITKVAEDQLLYNGLLLSISASIPPDFLMITDMEIEFIGRIRLLFVPSATSKNKDAIIIHHKVVEKINVTLAEHADEGVRNMFVVDYTEKLKRFPYLENIYKLFITFENNKLAVGEMKVINYKVNIEVDTRSTTTKRSYIIKRNLSDIPPILPTVKKPLYFKRDSWK